PAIDNRFSIVEVVSHNGGKIEAIPVSCSREILEKLKKDVKVIGIDEGQFFDTEVIKIIRDLIKQDKIVIVAGLDMDFRGEPFGPMPELMAMADEVLKLHAICVICGDDATMTQRIINGKPAHYSDPTILIGAEEKYEARCRQHHEVIE
ncbi:MAG: thymidine kinase, partial [Parcubacteria group bacterium]|nr:thymidine kinase [Parcubacteria group bacterium]